MPHPKCPEIVFPFEKIKKDVDESINELYELINKLNNKVSQQEKEINELKEIIKKNDTEKKIFEEKSIIHGQKIYLNINIKIKIFSIIH